MYLLHDKKVRTPFFLALIALAVLAAYANSFNNGFHFDDFHTVTDNPAIRSLSNTGRFFTDTSTFSVLPANRTYRPMVSASLALDYALGHGYEPLWFHLSTFLWFLVLLGLLFVLYREIFTRSGATGDAAFWLAIIGTAWFGLHPAIAETVNYVIQRGDLYCTLDCVAALVLWARRPELRKFGLYLLPLATALLSKPPAAVFPALLFFYAAFFGFEGPSRWKKAALTTLPSLAVVAAGMALQSAMTPKSFAPSMLDANAYRLTQPFVWLRYCGSLFLPIHLNADTDLNAFTEWNGQAVLGIVFVLLLGVAIFFTVRRKTLYPIAYGLLWFVITQLPTSLYALSETENDHRMFFSFVGLIAAVIWSVWLLVGKLSAVTFKRLRPVFAVLVLLILTGYAWGVHVRNQVWLNEDTLWKDDAEKSPHNGRGLMNYGLTLLNHGDYTGALAEFEKAEVYTPNYPSLEINLGVANASLNRNAEAERHFLRSVDLAPSDDETHAFYGRWLTQQGRFDDAIAQLSQAVTLDPQRPMQHDELIRAYELKGDIASAHEAAQQALQYIPGDQMALAALQMPIDPHAPSTRQPSPQAPPATQTPAAGDVASLINRSLVLNQAGKYEDSIAAAQEALKLDPNSAEAWNNIAANNESLGRWDEAIAAARKAVALKPDFQLAKNNLAWSLQQKAKSAH